MKFAIIALFGLVNSTTLRQMQAAGGTEGPPQDPPAPRDAGDMIGQMDGDNSGGATKEEMLGWVAQNMPEADRAKITDEINSHFEEADADGNGEVSP